MKKKHGQRRLKCKKLMRPYYNGHNGHNGHKDYNQHNHNNGNEKKELVL
jgi:hypothetical protein